MITKIFYRESGHHCKVLDITSNKLIACIKLKCDFTPLIYRNNKTKIGLWCTLIRNILFIHVNGLNIDNNRNINQVEDHIKDIKVLINMIT